ncbi:MAG: hypothetical protein HETSPECPRED_006866 [Heterodermia speciosa]|uniref:DUF788 domain protein n=1 Tax=Heterodermia speciosa TaxID=116794 RepID=A0A8H3FPY5_9LECA|nr:MAG: hypothetical protein HETSPECPRED_006866 [Heterodermia speciosa]
MAQKAAKQQATRNSAILKRTHLTSLAINLLFAILRFLVFRASCTRSTYLLYFFLSSPAFAIEFWLEKIGRPTTTPNGEVKRSGEDLEAKGLTEYLWDVLYWSWGCIAVASLVGDRAWWLWGVIPLYSVWLAYTTFGGMRQTMAGMAGQDGAAADGGGTSNRQKKLEKRGGQRMQYR